MFWKTCPLLRHLLLTSGAGVRSQHPDFRVSITREQDPAAHSGLPGSSRASAHLHATGASMNIEVTGRGRFNGTKGFIKYSLHMKRSM